MLHFTLGCSFVSKKSLGQVLLDAICPMLSTSHSFKRPIWCHPPFSQCPVPFPAASDYAGARETQGSLKGWKDILEQVITGSHSPASHPWKFQPVIRNLPMTTKVAGLETRYNPCYILNEPISHHKALSSGKWRRGWFSKLYGSGFRVDSRKVKPILCLIAV